MSSPTVSPPPVKGSRNSKVFTNDKGESITRPIPNIDDLAESIILNIRMHCNIPDHNFSDVGLRLIIESLVTAGYNACYREFVRAVYVKANTPGVTLEDFKQEPINLKGTPSFVMAEMQKLKQKQFNEQLEKKMAEKHSNPFMEEMFKKPATGAIIDSDEDEDEEEEDESGGGKKQDGDNKRSSRTN